MHTRYEDCGGIHVGVLSPFIGVQTTNDGKVTNREVCQWVKVVVNSETSPRPDRLGRRSENKPQDLLRQREEKRRYSKVHKKSTHNITWFHRSNRPCVCPQEKGRNFIKLWESTIRITYTSRWEDYKPLMTAKNSEPLWLSFSHESLT